MEESQTFVRRIADELRSAVAHGTLSAAEARSALADSAHQLPDAAHGEDLHRGGTLHMCPWHTCQATRHN
jgi:hypothetical protein